MKLKTILNRHQFYIKKVIREPYESVSSYYFYADKESEGVNQLVYYTGNVYDSNFGENELLQKCSELILDEWKNIVVERCKKYYIKAKNHSARELKSMMINRYKLID